MLTDTNLDTQAGEVAGNVPDAAPAAGPVGEPAAVALQGITKRFSDIYALSNVSITIQPGEVFGLLGPNGSGKSTLVKLLLGFFLPDEGTISLFGSTDLQLARANIGYMPERPHYHANFTGLDYLFFQARISGLTRSSAHKVVSRAIEATGLGPVAKRRIHYYERETLQRLALGVAMVSVTGEGPGLLILDEPSDGISRAVQISMRDIILDLKRAGMTVLISSRRITEVERASTSVGIVRGGRLMAQTYVENNPRVIIVAVPRDGAVESYQHLLAHLRNLHAFVTVTGGVNGTAPLVVSLPSGPHIMNAAGIKASALRALMEAGWDVISVYVERKDLESIYAQTAPPQPQGQPSQGAATGPLPNVTSPLASLPGSMATGRLPELTQNLGARGTRPLPASELGQLPVSDASPYINGYGNQPHQPIEGRTLRREEAQR